MKRAADLYVSGARFSFKEGDGISMYCKVDGLFPNVDRLNLFLDRFS
jgi:hypothetical protein